MAWTTPKTWASNDILTAADMNTYVRDNMNETAAAAATAAGDLVYADAANSMGTRLAIGATDALLAVNDAGTGVEWFDPSHTYTGTGVDYNIAATSTYESLTGALHEHADPGRDVHIYMAGMINFDGSGEAGSGQIRARLQNSVDGGATWSNGIDAISTISSGDYHSLFPHWLRINQTPTGAVHVCMQVWSAIDNSMVVNSNNLVSWLIPGLMDVTATSRLI